MVIEPIALLEDNYAWVLVPRSSREAIIVDPGEADAVHRILKRRKLVLAAILVTHHHADHVGGVPELTAGQDIPVFGPAREAVPGLTRPVVDGQSLSPAGVDLQVLETPGHTAGSVCYLHGDALFCGDTLFTGGCGRLFEGTAEQMHESLSRLASLPGDTRVYCAHEYTAANLGFAARVEPENQDLRTRRREVEALRARREPTVPSTVDLERRTNPFLRCNVPAVRAAAEEFASRPLTTETEVFAALRRWKDAT